MHLLQGTLAGMFQIRHNRYFFLIRKTNKQKNNINKQNLSLIVNQKQNKQQQKTFEKTYEKAG